MKMPRVWIMQGVNGGEYQVVTVMDAKRLFKGSIDECKAFISHWGYKLSK